MIKPRCLNSQYRPTPFYRLACKIALLPTHQRFFTVRGGECKQDMSFLQTVRLWCFFARARRRPVQAVHSWFTHVRWLSAIYLDSTAATGALLRSSTASPSRYSKPSEQSHWRFPIFFSDAIVGWVSANCKLLICFKGNLFRALQDNRSMYRKELCAFCYVRSDKTRSGPLIC